MTAAVEPEPRTAVRGHYDQQFTTLVELFGQGLGVTDVGAALTVVWRGRTVVDVWGGSRDQDGTEPWHADTPAPVMSVGKAMLAAMLVGLSEEGRLDLDAPIADVWPEFAANGKAGVTTRQVLTHTAGLPFHEAVDVDADWTAHEALAVSMERQAPRWQPGTTPAYHSLTLGTLVDGVIRRVTGQTASQRFEDYVARPRGLQVSLGCNEDAAPAQIGVSTQPEVPAADGCQADPTCGPLPAEPRRTPGLVNSERFRRSEWPSINCFATARGIAGFYASLLGHCDDLPMMVSADGVRELTTLAWADCERAGGQFKRMGLGVNLGDTAGNWFGDHDEAFGHGGKGGSTGFADRRLGFALGFVTNSLYDYDGSGPRTRALSREASRLVAALQEA